MVAWPIHVTVGLETLARRAAPSLATRGPSLGRAAAHARLHMNLNRSAPEALCTMGSVFRNPPSTWWAGWPGRGSVPMAAHAGTRTAKGRGRADGRTGRDSPPN